MRPIGGFFEAFEPGPADGRSILAAWTQDSSWTAFANARSALAALARLTEGCVWAPTYVCLDAATGIPADRLQLYGLDEQFEPDLRQLDPAPGDLVVTVSYFGRPIGVATQAFAQERPDVVWIEDRAQALDAGDGIPEAWRLHSPRKLVGVADGGILTTSRFGAPAPAPSRQAAAEALWAPCRLRQQDHEGLDNEAWHAANQAKERAMTAGGTAMTAESLQVLAQTPIAPLAAARLRNWRRLDERLHGWAAFGDITTPPLGYVLNLAPDVMDRLLPALHAERIFAAVHWRQTLGPDPHGWSRRLVTLPCDHRYGDAEMDRIADVVERGLG